MNEVPGSAIASVGPPGLVTGANVWQFGVLGVVVVALAYLAWYLFRRYEKRMDAEIAGFVVERKAMDEERRAMEEERKQCALDKERLRTEYEARHREMVVAYTHQFAEHTKASRENENAARREFAGTIEEMAEQQAKASSAQVAMIDKLTDRIVAAPKSGRY